MSYQIQLREGTAAAWTAANSVLAQGEEGHETDTGRRKVGDGVTAWNSLPYWPSASIVGAAPLASPTFTGTPTAPTASALTDSTQVATTAYADSAVAVETARAETAEALKAPLASPGLTGSPTAPTQTSGDNSTKIATDAFVDAAVAAETTRAEAAEALLAPKASPALTGTPTAPTAGPGTNTTQLATTAFVETAVGGAGAVASVFGRSGAVAAQSGDYTAAQVGAASTGALATETTRATAAEAQAQANAIAASLPTLAQASASASGTLALDTVTEVTAASALTMTLPTSTTGALIVVERASASTANVAVTGNIRGVAAQTITLQLSNESEAFFGTGASWWPIGGHKTLGSLQALFLQGASNLSDVGSAATARGNIGLAAQQVSAPTGSYSASYGDQVPVALGTTTGIVLPAPAGAGVETVSASAVSGTGTATVTVTGSGSLSAAVSPAVYPVLSSALATGSPITSLPVNALPAAIAAGKVTITQASGGTATQVFATTGAAAGATSIPVTSATPNFAYPTTSFMGASASVTSLPVNALPAAVAAGNVIVTSGTVSQVFATTGAAQSATSITVTAVTPAAYFPAGSAVAGSGAVLSGYYGQSASVPVNLGDQLAFQAFGSVWGYTPPASAATLSPGAPGSTPSNPVMLAPVKWAFINYNTSPLFLGTTYVYAYAGAGGVGDTVTAGANGVLSVDGGSPSVGDRALVCDPYAHGAGQPPHPDGIYVVTSAGSAGSKWVLTRSPDCNTVASLFSFWAVLITAGTMFAGGYASVSALSAIAGAQNYVPGGTFIRLQVSTLGAIAFGPSNTAVSTGNNPQQNFTMAVGTQATATGSGSMAVGNTATASGTYAHAYGFSSTASGQSSHSLGTFTQTPGFQSTALGVASGAGTDNAIAQASGNITTKGDAQAFTVFVFAKTTDATPTALSSSFSRTVKLQDYLGATSWKKTMLAAFTVVARRTDVPGTDSVWTCQGVLRGNGSSSYSWLGGSAPTPTVVAQDAGASAWVVAITVATNVITVTVTGAVGETIAWNAQMSITEVSG